MKLEDLLTDLANQGCYPCISRRGDIWRAHVNGAGNFWAEHKRPATALRKAIREWKKEGNPMDGYAATIEPLPW